MTFTMHLRDYYHWDITSDLSVFNTLHDSQMAMLHRFGLMREFRTWGKHSVKVTWDNP